MGCIESEPVPLNTFDTYAQELKMKGIKQPEFENKFQEVIWDTLPLSTKNYYHSESDKPWAVDEFGRGLKRDLLAFIKIAKEAGASGVGYVHTRIDRSRGLQFAGKIASPSGSNHLLSVRRTLDVDTCEVALKQRIDEPRIHLIVPYSDRATRLRVLLENVRDLRNAGADVVVVVCVLESQQTDADVATEISREVFGDKKAWQAVVTLSTNSGDADGAFSRGVALRDAVRDHVYSSNDVVFLCDVDLVLTNGFIERCAHNSILGQQIYYPVFYSLYPYGNSEPAVKQFNGFWRISSYGMACFRKQDFEDVDAFHDAETRFRGWGSEDVYLWEKVRNHSSLVAFRAVEPGLIHRWHSKECDRESHDFWDCMKTNFLTMGHPLRIGPQLIQKIGDEKTLYELATNS